MPRLRQAVVAAADLDATVARLQDELGLGEPYNDPAVAYFGLENAVFAIGDTFLEVVSPTRPDASAARHLERRGGDGGSMLMLQVEDLADARERANELGVREVFEVDVDEIGEVHLHPTDMRGAIVSLSHPKPPTAWKWGGPGWDERAAPGAIVGATVAVADPKDADERWGRILGSPVRDAGIEFAADPSEPGLTAVRLAGREGREPVQIGGVRFTFD